ncbi:hypothetical protein [Marinimicrobium agarilyticum]|uniref:hypothetical protein n=1 Tax=Marinimicrobium agarilyticum TaxID=306546 RepID=UPI00041551AA|nr:hypothetical protein [Marinimicrobium agarilyticum]
MQFEYDTTVLSVTRVTVEGTQFCSVFVGETPDPDKENDVHGFSVRKIPSDPAVFDQLNDIRYGDIKRKKLIMRMKGAAQGKAQPHVVGVVPDTKPAATASSKG